MTHEFVTASYARTLSIGQHKKKCPACSPTRKKKGDLSLSIQVTTEFMVYNCHHCGFSGRHDYPEKKVQMNNLTATKKPAPIKHEPLTEEATSWLSSRGISKDTATEAGLLSCMHYINSEGAEIPCIAFPYTVNGKGVGHKVRGIKTKGFSCTAPLRSFFNLDRVDRGDFLYIVEGEMDALSLIECGMTSVISVPNGALGKIKDRVPDKEDDLAFQFLWDAKGLLDECSRIIIATDNDSAGQAMAEELARRIGKDRCWKVNWPEGYKDANEILIATGKDNLERILKNHSPWPVAGIYDAKHFYDQVMNVYEQGLGKGLSTGYMDVDEIYTIAMGQLTVVTGIPGHGKSEFIDQVMMNLAKNHDYKFAVCSFENEPRLHIPKLMSKHCGKPFFTGPNDRMSPSEMDQSLQFVNDHFTFLYQADGSQATLDDIISRLKIAVMRHGISGAVIDPYNYIEKPRDMAETDWISDLLTRLRMFAQAHDIHLWFVAHPTKQQKENGTIPPPKGYDIAGSAAWFAKADFGLTVHRPEPTSPRSEIHVWKCRFSWLGQCGTADLIFDKVTSRYNPMPTYYYSKPEEIVVNAPF
jgi:twinkle protein